MTATVIPLFQYTLFTSHSIFYSALNTYGSMDFQSESRLVIAYSTHFRTQIS